MKRYPPIMMLATLLLYCIAFGVQAETVSDVLKLAQTGVGEEVQLAAVERSGTAFALDAQQIIELKKAGVSEKVIAAMLRKKGPVAVEGDGPREAGAQTDGVPPAPGTGNLNLENLDEKPWGYRIDTATRIIWITEPEAAKALQLNPHGGIALVVAAGDYELRYAGEGDGQRLTVTPNKKLLLMLSRVETTEFEGLYASIFADGERLGGGRLATLRSARKGGLPQANYKYVEPEPRTEERIVERERVIERPSTTVVYRSPVVYSWPYYAPYYYPYYGVYSPYYSHFGLRYNHYGKRSRVSVGVGIGF